MSPWQGRAGRTFAFAAAAWLGIATIIATPEAVWATEQPSSRSEASEMIVAESLTNLDDIDDALLVSHGEGSGTLTGEMRIGERSVTVPVSPDEGVLLRDGTGATLTIGLPNAEDAEDATPLANGAITFPGDLSASSVIVGGTGVQMLTTIARSDAPSRYSYPLSLNSDQRLEAIDGAPAVVGEDGEIVLSVASAWAKDANSADVPTRYEIDGDTLIHVVDHAATDGVAYPVVADPIAFRCIIGR